MRSLGRLAPGLERIRGHRVSGSTWDRGHPARSVLARCGQDARGPRRVSLRPVRRINCPPLTPGTDVAGIPHVAKIHPGGSMFARMFRFAVLALAIATPASFADDQKKDAPAKKSAGPALLVRVQSVNDLIKTV